MPQKEMRNRVKNLADQLEKAAWTVGAIKFSQGIWGTFYIETNPRLTLSVNLYDESRRGPERMAYPSDNFLVEHFRLEIVSQIASLSIEGEPETTDLEEAQDRMYDLADQDIRMETKAREALSLVKKIQRSASFLSLRQVRLGR